MTGHALHDPLALAAAAGSGAVLALALVAGIVRAVRTAERAESAITATVAAIATAGAVTGMWRVFTLALGMDPVAAGILCAVLELAMLAEAIRARRNLREHGTVGVDGAAVWVLATISAVLSASEEHGAVGRATRLVLPLVAAWLWERSLAAERRKVRHRAPVAWRCTMARVAVWLRLADPVERATSDVDRARRLARLTRARLRVALLEAPVARWVALATARPVRLAWAWWRLRRLALAAVEHLALGQDAQALAAIRATVADVVNLPALTDPAVLAPTAPHGAPPVAREPRQGAMPVARQEDDQVAQENTTGGAPPSRQDAPVAVARGDVADMTKDDQVAWFARQLARHPSRSVPEWMAESGLARRTVDRRLADARAMIAAGRDTTDPKEATER